MESPLAAGRRAPHLPPSLRSVPPAETTLQPLLSPSQPAGGRAGGDAALGPLRSRSRRKPHSGASPYETGFKSPKGRVRRKQHGVGTSASTATLARAPLPASSTSSAALLAAAPTLSLPRSHSAEALPPLRRAGSSASGGGRVDDDAAAHAPPQRHRLQPHEIVEDRANLDDLVRIGVARAQDVALLQLLRLWPHTLTDAQRKRVAMECAFREEWRTEREEAIASDLEGAVFFRDAPPSTDAPLLVTYLHKLLRVVAKDDAGFVAPLAVGSAPTTVLSVSSATSAACLAVGVVDGLAPPEAAAGGPAALTHVTRQVEAQRDAFRSALSSMSEPVAPEVQSEWDTSAAAAVSRLHAVRALDTAPVASPSRAAAGASTKAPPLAALSKMYGLPSPVLSPTATTPDTRSDARLARLGQAAAMNAARRYDAAVALQAFFRGCAARFRSRRKQQFQQYQQLKRHHWAGRVQRWFRRRHVFRRWREAHAARSQRYRDLSRLAVANWQARVSALRAARSRLCEAAGLPASTSPRAVPASAGEVRSWDAAAAIQTVVRRRQARAASASRTRCLQLVQGFCRMVLAHAVARRQRALARLRARRRMRRRFEHHRACQLAARAPLHDALTAFTHVDKEVSRADREAETEVQEFRQAWDAHQERVVKATLTGKLASHWVVQENPGGPDTYLDLRTGTVHDEHPLMKRARATLRQHKAQAAEQLQARLAVVREYKDKLLAGRSVRMAENFAKVSVVRDAHRVRRPASVVALDAQRSPVK